MKALKFALLAAASLTAVGASAAAKQDLAAGEKTYKATCVTCHGSGVMNAPKLGDKSAWAPRIKQGKDVLYQHAINGFKTMPAKGGNASLSDAEVRNAVDYMVAKSS